MESKETDIKYIKEMRKKIVEEKVEILKQRLRKKSLQKDIHKVKETKPKKHFFICTFGGCGEHILKKYLSFFGKADIVYSRWPPRRLKYVKNNMFIRKYIEQENIHNYTVIYLYRDPVYAILSKHFSSGHLLKIQASEKSFKLYDFFRHYFLPKENYTIYCIKSKDLFNIEYNSGKTLKSCFNISWNHVLNISNEDPDECLHNLCIEYNEKEIDITENNSLEILNLKQEYKEFNDIIKFLPFISIVEPLYK